MNALPCQSDVGQRLLDEMADEALREEHRVAALDEMAESSYWLRKWHRDDDSDRTVTACMELGFLLLASDGLPSGHSERADQERDDFDAIHETLRECFDAWATANKPSHLDCYMEAERLAREADRADDMEGEA